MKIALQEGLLPGDSLAEKLDCAEELQIEGLEVGGRSRLYDHIETYENALSGRAIKIVSICGQETFDWLDPDPHKRNASLAETRRQLDACGHFQAVEQIVPPIFGPSRIPDLSPLKDAIALEKDLLVELVKELEPAAARIRSEAAEAARRAQNRKAETVADRALAKLINEGPGKEAKNSEGVEAGTVEGFPYLRNAKVA